ncbi:unnamed protein product [[Actinomadura] parvosata subsp. kistnae]|nr:unnamed protein product [Actinomadura parvosata subsp. kistnae]
MPVHPRLDNLDLRVLLPPERQATACAIGVRGGRGRIPPGAGRGRGTARHGSRRASSSGPTPAPARTPAPPARAGAVVADHDVIAGIGVERPDHHQRATRVPREAEPGRAQHHAGEPAQTSAAHHQGVGRFRLAAQPRQHSARDQGGRDGHRGCDRSRPRGGVAQQDMAPLGQGLHTVRRVFGSPRLTYVDDPQRPLPEAGVLGRPRQGRRRRRRSVEAHHDSSVHHRPPPLR